MTCSFSIVIDSVLQSVFYMAGIIAFIVIIVYTVKDKKSFNPLLIIKGIFKLVFDTEGKIDTGRLNLFFGICSFVYILTALVSDNFVANYFSENPKVSSNLIYFIVFTITIIVCVVIVSTHERKTSTTKSDNTDISR